MTIRTRMWVERLLAAGAGVLTLVTALWPTWIEGLVEASPDGGDGSAERLLALGWLAATLVFAALARRDRRRLTAAAT
jgi:hypothetical protein